MIQRPQVLLLDEATSALDPTSEKRVQSALELASQGPTTLVVAHRLSTITNADKIVFLKDGVVAEQGTHEELMERRGLYCELVNITQRKEATEADEGAVVGRPLQKSQNLSDEETDDDEEDEEEDEEPELHTSGSSRDSGFRASTRRKRKYQKSDTTSMF